MQSDETRQLSVYSSLIRSLGALAILGAFAACEGMPEGADDGTTETTPETTVTTSGALLNNIPYLPGQIASKQTGPGAAIFQAKGFLAFVRTDGKIGIIIENNLGDNTGQSPQTFALTDTTNYGPCLVVFQNMLHLIYVDTGSLLKMRRSSDGVNWTAPEAIDGNPLFMFQPTAVEFNGMLHVFAVINNGVNSILEVIWNGSSEFGNFFTGNSDSANRGPYAAVWNGQIFLTWAATNTNNAIFIKHGSGQSSWGSTTVVPNNFGYPALYPISSQTLAMVYRGNNARIFRLNTMDGVTFTSPVMDTGSSTNVTAIPFVPVDLVHGKVWTLYTGQNGQLFTVKE